MANYYCSARTNYFRVKDREAFNAFAQKIGAEVIEDDSSPEEDKRVGLLPGDDDDGGFRNYDTETDEELESDVIGEISKHLAPGSIAVLIEAGAEKLRYIHGHAVAINDRGERVNVNLSEIYKLAETHLGGEVTPAEY